MELGRPVAVYRSSIPALLACATRAALSAGLGIAALRLLLGLPFLEAACQLAATIWIGTALVLALGWAVSRVQVFEGGLRSYDFQGRTHAVPWGAMQGARVARMLGLRYVVVSAEPKLELWVPAFLDDQTGFRAALSRHAGPAHPLTRSLVEAATGA